MARDGEHPTCVRTEAPARRHRRGTEKKGSRPIARQKRETSVLPLDDGVGHYEQSSASPLAHSMLPFSHAPSSVSSYLHAAVSRPHLDDNRGRAPIPLRSLSFRTQNGDLVRHPKRRPILAVYGKSRLCAGIGPH